MKHEKELHVMLKNNSWIQTSSSQSHWQPQGQTFKAADKYANTLVNKLSIPCHDINKCQFTARHVGTLTKSSAHHEWRGKRVGGSQCPRTMLYEYCMCVYVTGFGVSDRLNPYGTWMCPWTFTRHGKNTSAADIFYTTFLCRLCVSGVATKGHTREGIRVGPAVGMGHSTWRVTQDDKWRHPPRLTFILPTF